MKTLCGFAAAGFAIILILGGIEARTWTSAKDPSKKLEGELISSDGTNVEIKMANGQTIKTVLSFFSQADQDFVAAQSKPATTPGTPPTPAPADGKPAPPPSPEDLEPVKFEVWKIRDCCSKAERMYEDAVADVDGITLDFDKNTVGDKIMILDAETKIGAREAIAKIIAAGLYGGSTSREFPIKGAATKAKGNMTVSGVVFCCNESVGNLENAMKRSRGAVDGEKGVTDHTIKKSNETFEVKGTATGNEILRHARDLGFNITVEDTPAEPAEPE